MNDLKTCKNCLTRFEGKCDNPGSAMYDIKVADNSSCSEWDSKMKFK